MGEQSAPQGCPFCPGSEDQTPPEVLAVRPNGGPADSPGWLVRAFPNRYPALTPDEGPHEVIVNSPRHVALLGELTDDEAARAVGTWAARLDAVSRDPRGLWPFLFLNQGVGAGASLRHTHAQLVGLPIEAPRLVAREDAFLAAARCPVCADIDDAGTRLVAAGDRLVVWCPRVPPFTGALRMAPAAHAPDWSAHLDADALGRALRRHTSRMAEAMGTDAVNLWLNQRRPGGTDRFHWYVDLLPRRAVPAGLELGADVVAVAQAPEVTAALLRKAPEAIR